jgi:hypothetical protein
LLLGVHVPGPVVSVPGQQAVGRILGPLREFLQAEASGGLVLLGATVVALVWANSPFADSYNDLWHTTLTIGAGGLQVSEDLQHWINDGLMAVFFFVVGLEIKRELVVGELRDPRRATLPAVAAIGGVVLPAVLFLALNHGGPGARGWGMPMATDIAFAARGHDPPAPVGRRCLGRDRLHGLAVHRGPGLLPGPRGRRQHRQGRHPGRLTGERAAGCIRPGRRPA